MRKIIAAFEASQFSEGVMNFISKINAAEQVTVTGIFLPAPIYTQFWNYTDVIAPDILLPLSNDETESAEANITIGKFKEYCRDHHLRHRVINKLSDFSLSELKMQSRFADLMVISSEHFFTIPHSDTLSDYLKTSLHEAECPVVVVPENYAEPQYNILTFDGSESSAKAIKNFSYLLPEFVKNPTTVVSFGAKTDDEKEQYTRMKELVSVHFPDCTYTNAGNDSDKYFSAWEKGDKPAIIVSGAFGRSILSILFKHSFINDVLQNKKLPVFISHR